MENDFRRILLAELPELTRFIPEDQNGNQPELPYASYKITSIQHQGRVARYMIQPDYTRPFDEHYKVMFRVTVYGSASQQIIQKLSLALCKESVTQEMAKCNIAYSTKTPPRKLPELIQASWQDRTQITITCLSVSNGDEVVNTIESMELTQTVNGGQAHTDIIEIPISGNINP